MEQKIALVQMPYWTLDCLPLALATVASVLKGKRLELKCFDFNIEFKGPRMRQGIFFEKHTLKLLFPEYYCKPSKDFLDSSSKIDRFINECLNKIIPFNPNIVAFSVSTYAMQAFCLLLAKKIKSFNPKIMVVFGGAIYTRGFSNDLPLKTGLVDEIVFKGEENLFFNRFEDKTFDYDPNIVHFDFFDLNRYKLRWLPVLWTSGCNMNCKFCVHPKIGGAHKTLNIERIIKQIKYYVQNYKTKVFRLNDSNINQNPRFLAEVCDRIISEKLDISWSGDFYIHKNTKTSLLKKMAKAGCRTLFIGLESGSQKVLDELNKKFTVNTAKSIIKKVRKCGIKMYLYLIVGSPSESHEDYLETLKLLCEFRNYINGISVMPLHYIRGSQWYEEAKEKGLIKANLPPKLKTYEEYFPYTYFPKSTFNGSTISTRSYLWDATLHFFETQLKAENLSLIISNSYYYNNKNITLNKKVDISKPESTYYFRIPSGLYRMEVLVNTLRKRAKIMLDVNYAYYCGNKKQFMDILDKILESGADLKFCRPIPPCLLHDTQPADGRFIQSCKDCSSYLYLNKNKKIVYCKDKFWDYYIKVDNSMAELCKQCLYQRKGGCKMYCIQYFANKPL